MKGILDIAMWLIVASLVVLVITNPTGFASDVSAIGTFVQGESSILSGGGARAGGTARVRGRG